MKTTLPLKKPYLSTNHCRIIHGNYQKFKKDILPSQRFRCLRHTAVLYRGEDGCQD